MRQLTLTEFTPSESITLSEAERDALQLVVPSINISHVPRASNQYILRPGAEIGSVNLGALQVIIRPRYHLRHVLFMLSYALDPRKWRSLPFGYEETTSLLDAIVPAFVTHVRSAFRRGLLQGYQAREDTLMSIRGRIRFGDQLRRRQDLPLPVEVQYEEYTEDIAENRLIKAAIERLRHLSLRSAEARQSLRAFELPLAPVQSINYHPQRVPDVTYTRLNEHYRYAVELARLILRSTSFEQHYGTVTATTFLVNMFAVFENFVVIALRNALALPERAFPQGRLIYLDESARIRLYPDISWWEDGQCVFVGDVKYKTLNGTDGRPNDLYQLLAYLNATALRAGLLIYAAGEQPPTFHRMRHSGHELHIATLNPQQYPESVLDEVNKLAGMVRNLRTIPWRGGVNRLR
jgi:5-methylcytosine-specific restriction enzyme subunit McrC